MAKKSAIKVGFEIDPKWTTHQAGVNLIKAHGESNMAEIGKYTIVKNLSVVAR